MSFDQGRICQTSGASPAEPGGLPITLGLPSDSTAVAKLVTTYFIGFSVGQLRGGYALVAGFGEDT